MSNALIAAPALLAVAIAQAAPAEPGALKTLWANTGTDSGVGVVSQTFEASLESHDSAAADDFTVPDGETWTIREVDVAGHYFNGSGPADSETVTIYKAKHGKVGPVVVNYAGLVGSDNDGSFSIPIPKTTLETGTYFVSVVANMPFAQGGEWHWENMLEVHGLRPEWENPGGERCRTWTVETKCFGPGTGDHFFALKGHAR